ncbi:MAG: hypothetical protein IJS60_06655 [Abditibacteriota bacterium]|nr:hypothetical protein [Abditibacteriota bacterium]
MKTGKLPPKLLAELINNLPTNEDVICGSKIGFDAAKIKTSNKNLIIGSDPITFNTDNIGKFCIYINANDIAVSGAVPKFFMATILFPPSINEKEVKTIFNQLKDTCKELGIALIGGHTEITDCVTRPVISGTMFGEEIYTIDPEKTEIGCDIVLINKPAIEGTYLLAYNAKEKLLSAGIKKTKIDYALGLLEAQGICVLPTVKTVLENITEDNTIYYMHDPTEGGVASALLEVSYAINKSIDIDNIEFMEETEEFCKVFGLNPLGLISSGSLLVVTKDGNAIKKSLEKQDIYSQVIGKVSNKKPSVKYKGKKTVNFSRDEIARFFESLE